MRKKTISFVLDNLMWYILYLLPIVIWFIILARNEFNMAYNLEYVFNTMDLGIVSNNSIYTALVSLFGAEGLVPVFASSSLLMYFTYFVWVMIIHLAVDFLLLLPRLCHKWMNLFDKEC